MMQDCPQTSGEQTSYLFQAIEDHTPKQDGEMSLIRGDLISDVQTLNMQWGIGRNYRGFVGMFPLKCVVKVDNGVSNISSPLRLPVDALLSDIGQMRHSDDEVTHSSKANTPIHMEMIESVENGENVDSNIDEQFVRYTRNSDNITTNINDIQTDFHNEQDCRYKTDQGDNPDNQTKESSKYFSKPKMLVKPRPGKTNKMSSKLGSLSSLRNSTQSNKDIVKITSTFPTKNSTSNQIWKPKQPHESESYFQNPSSEMNLTCPCKHITGPNYFIRRPPLPPNHQHVSNVELYENVTSKTNNQQNSNESSGNKIVYTKVNKKPLIKPRSMQTLSNTASFTTDSVYSEPNVDSRALLTNSLQKQSSSRAPPRTHRNISFLRVAGCAMTSLLLAVFVSSLMYFALDYDVLYVFITFCTISTICFILLMISRLLRCMLATILPSLATSKGNVFLIILMWVSLILGPIVNIEHNLTTTIDSMSCMMEHIYNQTNAIMRPYDSVINQINNTIGKLEISAQNVMNGLLPLDRGLERVELGVKNGRINLLGTKKTCQDQISRAHEACERGLQQAHNQCQNVLQQIGTVYQQAKQALDNLDPNKWGQTSGKFKRQASSRSESMTSRHNQLICKSLNDPSICKNQTKPEDICQPASWAGNAIQEAINETQSALSQLMRSLQFHVTSTPYLNARAKAFKESINFNQKILTTYQFHLYYFNLAITLIVKLCPILILIVINAAYVYIKNYVTDDKYDNRYLDKDFDGIDHMISSITNRPLLVPFRGHEKIYIKNQMQYEKARKCNHQIYTFLLNLLAVALIYYISYRHVYALQLITEGYKVKNLDGLESLEMVVVGEGMFVELLDVFLRGFHPSEIWNNDITNSTLCLPKPENISLTVLSIILALNLLLFLFIVIKGPLMKWRHKVVSYFYRERHQSRLIWLHDHMSFRRSLYPEIIYEEVRYKHRKMLMANKISSLYSCVVNLKSSCKTRRCLVCNKKESNQSLRCTTENCVGIYCQSCFRDMRETCPLCHFDIIR